MGSRLPMDPPASSSGRPWSSDVNAATRGSAASSLVGNHLSARESRTAHDSILALAALLEIKKKSPLQHGNYSSPPHPSTPLVGVASPARTTTPGGGAASSASSPHSSAAQRQVASPSSSLSPVAMAAPAATTAVQQGYHTAKLLQPKFTTTTPTATAMVQHAAAQQVLMGHSYPQVHVAAAPSPLVQLQQHQQQHQQQQRQQALAATHQHAMQSANAAVLMAYGMSPMAAVAVAAGPPPAAASPRPPTPQGLVGRPSQQQHHHTRRLVSVGQHQQVMPVAILPHATHHTSQQHQQHPSGQSHTASPPPPFAAGASHGMMPQRTGGVPASLAIPANVSQGPPSKDPPRGAGGRAVVGVSPAATTMAGRRSKSPPSSSSSWGRQTTRNNLPADVIRAEEVEAALKSKPQRGKKRDNLSMSERLELTRTRNREHAKSTRVRKKARYQELLDREAEWTAMKNQEALEDVRRRCVVEFLSWRAESLRHGGPCSQPEESSSSTTKDTPAPHLASAAPSPAAGDNDTSEPEMRDTPVANSRDSPSDSFASETTSTATSNDRRPEDDSCATSKGADVPTMTDPDDPTTRPQDSSMEGTHALAEEEGGECATVAEETKARTREEHEPTSFGYYIQDPSRFTFGSLVSQAEPIDKSTNMDGILALSRHEGACRDCVVQHFGEEATKTLAFSVVDGEDGVATTSRDAAFAQFHLTVTLGTPPQQEDRQAQQDASHLNRSVVVSSGVVRVKFAPESHKMESMELCSYGKLPLAAGDGGGHAAEGQNVAAVGSPRGRMVIPLSFPSVISLETTECPLHSSHETQQSHKKPRVGGIPTSTSAASSAASAKPPASSDFLPALRGGATNALLSRGDRSQSMDQFGVGMNYECSQEDGSTPSRPEQQQR